MPASRPLGVINEINARWDPTKLYVFDDRLVVVRANFREWLGRMLVMELGIIGMLIQQVIRSVRKATAEQELEQSAGELMARPKAAEIMARDIIDARLSSGMLGEKLRLSLVDGTSREFSWAKSQNDYHQVLGFLGAALGTKLVDEKKAA